MVEHAEINSGMQNLICVYLTCLCLHVWNKRCLGEYTEGKRQQTTESYCVFSESENATSLKLITNIEFLLYTIYNFLLHCQKQIYYLQATSDGMLRITVSLLIVDTLRLKLQFTKNDNMYE
jgi:hypothetical protein